MKKVTGILMGLIVMLSSCEAEEIMIEEHTTTHISGTPVGGGEGGSGTMTCVLNGEEWSASSITANYVVDDEVLLNQLSVTGGVDGFLINLGMKGTYEEGVSGLDLEVYDGEIASHNAFVILSESMSIVGNAPLPDIGFITITLTEFDFESMLCSGTFEFSAASSDNPDEIGFEATDGVFENVTFGII